MPGSLRGVQLISAGKWNSASHGETEFTVGDLEEMVISFRELGTRAGFRPHLKLGHTEAQKFFGQRAGFPSLGEVVRVWRDGPSVFADVDNVPDPLIELIRNRRYTQLSIELYPEYEYEGSKFSNVLVGVALLGAELPAVKGLRDLAQALYQDEPKLFAEAEDPLELTEMPQGNKDDENKDGGKKTEVATDPALAAQLAEAQEQNKTMSTALEAAQARITALEESGARSRIELAVDTAIKDGKLAPKSRDLAIALGAALPASKKVSLTEGEGDAAKTVEKDLASAFVAFLGGLEKVVDLSEHGSGTEHESERDGGDAATASEEVATKAQALVDGGKAKNFAEGRAKVLADPANADLKERYARGD